MAQPNKKPRMPDPMQFAIAIVEGVTGETLTDRPTVPAKPEKSPVAVARGRKGGQIGGKARAAKLTKAQRTDAAKKAATARWKKS